jgi:NADH:ubiquinone oxidoreductase subunit 3 (subunit A)
MATRSQDISRFCINYQKFIILLVIVLTIQIFLAVRVLLIPGSWDNGDEKGPYYSARKSTSQKEGNEVCIAGYLFNLRFVAIKSDKGF